MRTGEETGLADDILTWLLFVVPGMRRKLGELRNSGAATPQFTWNMEHTTHACEIRKLAWAILYWFMDEVQCEHAYQGGGVVWRMA